MRLSSIILLTTLFILFLNFKSTIVILDVNLDVKYHTQTHSLHGNGSKEFNKVESVKTDSFTLYGHSTHGVPTWAKNSDWVSYDFETVPSLIIKVSMVDEAEWNTQPKDGIFTNSIFGSIDEEGSGVFFPSHEDKWRIAFQNPTSITTEVYYTIETSDYIIIRNPSSSTTVYTDSILEINWETNFGTWVNIDLYKGNLFKTALLDHTYNDEYASFHIPEDFIEGNNYKIKITDESLNEFDFSDQFSIKHPKIEVIYPFQGDTYIPHTTRSIIWTSSGVNSKVSIELYLDSIKILQISNETPNDGEFKWTIWQGDEYALDTYSNYQIQIKDINSQKYIGTSPFFTITKEHYMNILTPTHNSLFKTGNYIDISWDTDSPAYWVNIWIMQNDSIIENITDVRNNGLFQWKIPNDFENGVNYYIRIETPDNSVNVISKLFTIEYVPKPKVSGYNIPLFSLFFGLIIGIFIFSFSYKKKR